MKSLRYLSTISALALCAVFALAQDPGLGRGRGGGGGNGGGSNPPSKPSSAPRNDPPSRGPSNPPAQPRQDPPRSNPTPPRQDPPRSNPAPRQDPPRSNPAPRQDPPRQDPPRSNPTPPRNDPPRSQPSNPPSTPPQDGGLGRGRGNGGGNSGGNSTPPQDGGLGRGRGQGGGNSGGNSNPPSRGNDNSGPTRDRGGNNPPTRGNDNPGSSRDRGGNTDPGLGRGNNRGGNAPGATRGRDPQTPSRSGNVKYQGSNNTSTRQVPNANYNIPPRSRGIINTNTMEFRAARQDAPRNGNSLYYNGWRTGYSHYNPNFVDVNFWYPNYCFTPYAGINVVISPWYSYTFLPAYLNCNRVTVINYRSPWFWNTGNVYVYDSGYSNWGYDRNSARNRDLEYAVDDLVDGFERQDYRSLQRVIPDRGRVAIFRDGDYDYSLDVRDFEDLMNDLVSNAETGNYRILESRTYRNSAKISAVHEYRDQWGNRQRVYHMIYLEEEDGRLVIREFGTSNRRVW